MTAPQNDGRVSRAFEVAASTAARLDGVYRELGQLRDSISNLDDKVDRAFDRINGRLWKAALAVLTVILMALGYLYVQVDQNRQATLTAIQQYVATHK